MRTDWLTHVSLTAVQREKVSTFPQPLLFLAAFMDYFSENFLHEEAFQTVLVSIEVRGFMHDSAFY